MTEKIKYAYPSVEVLEMLSQNTICASETGNMEDFGDGGDASNLFN